MEIVKKISNTQRAEGLRWAIKSKATFLKNWHIFLILFLLGWLAYTNVVNGEFIWDDRTIILLNEHVHSFKYFPQWFTQSTLAGAGMENSNFYRPITTLIYAVVYSIFGEMEFGYHSLNILLHITNAFLVFVFLRKLNFAKFGSLLGAVIFLLHPVQTESVSYVAGLPDILSLLFILLGLNIFAETKTSLNLKRKLSILFFFLLAILSKEIAITFAPLAILTVWYKWRDYDQKTKSEIVKTMIGVLAVTAVYIVLKLTILNFTGKLNLNSGENIYTQNALFRTYTFLTSIVEYMKLLIYPTGLYFEKPFLIFTTFSARVQLGLIITFLMAMGAGISLYKRKHFYFAVVWLIVTIIPVSGMIIPANATYKEHWLYMPLIGIAFLISSIWESLKSERLKRIFLTVFTIISILYVAQTIHRNTQWQSFQTFFAVEMEHNKISSRLRDRVGTYYFEKGEYEKAAEYFKEAAALDAGNKMPNIRTALGNSYLAMKNLHAAVNEYFTVLSVHPNHFEAHVALYNIAIATGNKEMEETFLKFLQRIEAGGNVDFENEILPFATVND